MDRTFDLMTLVLEMLIIVSVVVVAGRRFRIPPTVGLVLAGLALSLRPGIHAELAPDLILALFLPPLVFEAAFHINLDSLRRNLGTVALLAGPGVMSEHGHRRGHRDAGSRTFTGHGAALWGPHRRHRSSVRRGARPAARRAEAT